MAPVCWPWADSGYVARGDSEADGVRVQECFGIGDGDGDMEADAQDEAERWI
jgi:hypothetical protein